MSARTVEALADTFRVLGDPTRVRILDALSGGELCVCDIASLVGLSESAVSHQLRLLRGMRLVRPRRSGRLVYYAVDDQHILELLAQALTHVEEARLGTGGPSTATPNALAIAAPPAAHRLRQKPSSPRRIAKGASR
jgi:ArsR family transcriptional regulator, lead/cadmium/zinc/bismuth-responsive transcriptional repressor